MANPEGVGKQRRGKGARGKRGMRKVRVAAQAAANQRRAARKGDSRAAS